MNLNKIYISPKEIEDGSLKVYTTKECGWSGFLAGFFGSLGISIISGIALGVRGYLLTAPGTKAYNEGMMIRQTILPHLQKIEATTDPYVIKSEFLKALQDLDYIGRLHEQHTHIDKVEDINKLAEGLPKYDFVPDNPDFDLTARILFWWKAKFYEPNVNYAVSTLKRVLESNYNSPIIEQMIKALKEIEFYEQEINRLTSDLTSVREQISSITERWKEAIETGNYSVAEKLLLQNLALKMQASDLSQSISSYYQAMNEARDTIAKNLGSIDAIVQDTRVIVEGVSRMRTSGTVYWDDTNILLGQIAVHSFLLSPIVGIAGGLAKSIYDIKKKSRSYRW
jgi:chromosome segregation ATPase